MSIAEVDTASLQNFLIISSGVWDEGCVTGQWLTTICVLASENSKNVSLFVHTFVGFRGCRYDGLSLSERTTLNGWSFRRFISTVESIFRGVVHHDDGGKAHALPHSYWLSLNASCHYDTPNSEDVSHSGGETSRTSTV